MTNTAETEYAEFDPDDEIANDPYETCEHIWASHDDQSSLGEGCARCGIPQAAFEKLSSLLAENARLKEARSENNRLRAALANSDQPCIYCALPADEWAGCKDGFPGCARGDDAVGCPHLGAGLRVEDLLSKNTRLKEALLGLRNSADGLRIEEACIREVIGNTNWEVIRHWIEKADAALHGDPHLVQPQQSPGEPLCDHPGAEEAQ